MQAWRGVYLIQTKEEENLIASGMVLLLWFARREHCLTRISSY